VTDTALKPNTIQRLTVSYFYKLYIVPPENCSVELKQIVDSSAK